MLFIRVLCSYCSFEDDDDDDDEEEESDSERFILLMFENNSFKSSVSLPYGIERSFNLFSSFDTESDGNGFIL